jgi:hypothetical protein
MSVFLDAGKEWLSLIDYTFKDDTFQFVFPRPKKVSPNEKLGVEFIHPKIERIGQQRAFTQIRPWSRKPPSLPTLHSR